MKIFWELREELELVSHYTNSCYPYSLCLDEFSAFVGHIRVVLGADSAEYVTAYNSKITTYWSTFIRFSSVSKQLAGHWCRNILPHAQVTPSNIKHFWDVIKSNVRSINPDGCIFPFIFLRNSLTITISFSGKLLRKEE